MIDRHNSEEGHSSRKNIPQIYCELRVSRGCSGVITLYKESLLGISDYSTNYIYLVPFGLPIGVASHSSGVAMHSNMVYKKSKEG